MAASVVVRTTRDRRLLDEWCLVLRAADMPHETAVVGGALTLTVDSSIAAEVIDALAGYDEERRQRRRPATPATPRSANVAWVAATAILVTYMALGEVSSDSLSFTQGSARSIAIRQGEIWRAVTALTLHADAMHAISNAVCAVLFLSPVCHLVGGGTALALTSTAGMAANLVNAFVRGPGYTGIGASTAIFAALGILAGIRAVQDLPQPMWRRMRPLAAALALLAMLGASPQTDVVAHLLGLFVGVLTGASFATWRRLPPSDAADRSIGLAAVALYAGAWAMALAAA